MITQYNKIRKILDYYEEFYENMTQEEIKDVLRFLKKLGVTKLNWTKINDLLKKNVIIKLEKLTPFDYDYI